MSSLFDRVIGAMAWIAGALLLFQVVSVSGDVMVRYFFGVSIRWVITLNEWSLLFIAFLAAAWLQRQGGHVRLDILIDRFGPKWRAAADLFALAVGIFVCAILVWFGTRVTWAKYLTNEYDYFKLDDVPIYIIYVIIPIGGLMLLLQLVRDVRRRIRSLSDPDAVQIEERKVDL